MALPSIQSSLELVILRSLISTLGTEEAAKEILGAYLVLAKPGALLEKPKTILGVQEALALAQKHRLAAGLPPEMTPSWVVTAIMEASGGTLSTTLLFPPAPGREAG